MEGCHVLLDWGELALANTSVAGDQNFNSLFQPNAITGVDISNESIIMKGTFKRGLNFL